MTGHARARSGLLLALAAALTGCDMDFDVTVPCIREMCGTVPEYPPQLDIIGFPAAAIAAADSSGEVWGRIRVGDTLRLSVVRWRSQLESDNGPCTTPDTLHGVRWAVTAVGGNARLGGDTAAAAVVGADTGRVGRIVARAPGTFGVTFYQNEGTAAAPVWVGQDSGWWLITCEPRSGDRSLAVPMVRVVPRDSAGAS